MDEFSIPEIKKGTFTYKKIEPYISSIQRGLGGEAIEEILKEAEENGYLTLPLVLTKPQYESLRKTFMDHCRKKNLLNVVVYVDDKWNRAFACFDTITLPYDEQVLSISEMVLSLELETYYASLDRTDRGRLFLPAGLNPYTHSRHKTNHFILPKQICFSFYRDRPEIFRFALRKLRFGK